MKALDVHSVLTRNKDAVGRLAAGTLGQSGVRTSDADTWELIVAMARLSERYLAQQEAERNPTTNCLHEVNLV